MDGRSLRAELTLNESNATKMIISGNNDGAGCIDKGNYNAQPSYQTTCMSLMLWVMTFLVGGGPQADRRNCPQFSTRQRGAWTTGNLPSSGLTHRAAVAQKSGDGRCPLPDKAVTKTIVASDLTQSSCGTDVFIRHIEHL